MSWFVNEYENGKFCVYANENRAKMYGEPASIKPVPVSPNATGEPLFVIVRKDNGYPLLAYPDKKKAQTIAELNHCELVTVKLPAIAPAAVENPLLAKIDGKVLEIVNHQLSSNEIVPSSKLLSFGMDQMDLDEIIFEVEIEFNFDFPGSLKEAITTPSDIIDVVESFLTR